MKKLLIITPHLSTGGLPQVVCKKIELLRDEFQIKCLEWSCVSHEYVVQRNKISRFLNQNLITLGENKRDELSSILKEYEPDVVCLEEFPEMFMDNDSILEVYSDDRKWRITETTHSSTFPVISKKWLPDRFVFVSEFTKRNYDRLGVPIDVIEYPVDKKERDQREAQERLSLDPEYKHIITVGLFTRNKNQGYAFEIAKKLSHEKIKFHFIGNQAMNFEDYWGPLMKNKPDNCIVWGERSDVDDFLRAADVFLFTSILELNPLCVKEAMEYQLPVMLFQLDTYCGKYKDMDNVYELTGNSTKDSLKLSEIILDEPKDESHKFLPLVNSPVIKLVHLLLNPEYRADVPEESWISGVQKQEKSIECFDKLKYKFSAYSQIFSNVNRTELPIENCASPSNLYRNENFEVKPYTLSYGHYGAYIAHKRGIIQEFSDECDCILVIEGDAYTNLDSEEFYAKVLEAYKLGMEKNASLVTLAGIYFLNREDFWDHVEDVDGYPDFVKVPHFLMGTAYLVFKKEREAIRHKLETRGWQSPDIWLAWNYDKEGGVYASRHHFVYQVSGYSLLDFHEKPDQSSFQPDKKKAHRSRIGVLVINLNNLQYTKDCLSDLTKQDVELDLCFIDQNSTEAGTSEYIENIRESLIGEFSSIKTLEIIRNDKNEDLNHLWNVFVEKYDNEFLCILNNDVRIAPNFLSSSILVFEREPSVGFVSHSSNNKDYSEWYEDADYRIIESPYRQGWDFCFRRDCYSRIPDQVRFFYGDDYIFSKLFSSGMKGAYVLNSPMLHYERSTTVEKGGQRDASLDANAFYSLDVEHKNLSFVEEYSKWKPEFSELKKREPVVEIPNKQTLDETSQKIDLSILICSLLERRNEFLDPLLTNLEKQIEGKTNVEIIVISDNASRKIGRKRNDAISIARGEYVCFIDDDDRVSEDYVDLILEEIQKWRPDVVVFDAVITKNGENPKNVKFGREYDHCERPESYYRRPNHLSVHKKSNIKEYFLDVSTGEDDEWASRMLDRIVTQQRIEKPLYFYDYRTTTKKYFN